MNKADFDKISENTFNPIDGKEYKIKDFFRERDFINDKNSGTFVKHAGLLRVLKKLFSIDSYWANVKQVPLKDNEFCATVEVHYKVSNITSGIPRVFDWTATADCHRLNSMSGFEYYTTTIAETRASARALRNLLGVEFCSKEEVAGDIAGADTDLPIQGNQRVLLETKFMGELKVSLDEMSKIVNKQLNTLDDLSKDEAANLIEKLNSKRTKKKED